MKNIYELLKMVGVEVPEEKKEEFDKLVEENYKTVADYNKQKDKLDKANDELKQKKETIDDLNEQIKGFEGTDETITKLQEQVKAYEDAEKQRAEDAKAKKDDEELTARIANELGEVEFINEFTKNSIYDAIKAGVKADNTKGVKTIFNELTKDKEGIFKNPQDPVNLPGGGSGGNEVKYTREQIKKMSPDEINNNWADIQKSLKDMKGE